MDYCKLKIRKRLVELNGNSTENNEGCMDGDLINRITKVQINTNNYLLRQNIITTIRKIT